MRIWLKSPIRGWKSLWHLGQRRFIGTLLVELSLPLDLESCFLFLTSLTLTPVQWRDQNFFRGGIEGKMRFWGGKNPKICQKWLSWTFFSSDWGASGGQSLRWGGEKCPMPPLMPPLLRCNSTIHNDAPLDVSFLSQGFPVIHINVESFQ